MGGLERLDQVGCRSEVRAVAGLSRRDAERDRQVRLPDAGRTEQDDVPVLLHEPQRGELGDELSIEVGLEIEVEIGQGLVDGIAGEAEPATKTPRLSGFVLQLQEPLQNLRGGQVFRQRSVELATQMLFRGREPEIGEVLAEPLVGRRLAHSAATSYSRRSRA